MRKTTLWWSALLLCAALCGCGAGGNAPAETLSGTAATGAPIANADVVVKDSTGASVSTTTNAQGEYTATVTGMVPPFLAQVTIPTGGELFSIATETGTANIDPYSDLMADAFYAVRGTTPEAVFPTLGPTTDLPNEVEVDALEGIVERMIQPWLVATGVDPAAFDVVTTPYMANGTGYDQVLEYTTITAGQLSLAGITAVEVATVQITDGVTTQDSTFTADGAGNLAVSTTTTGPGGTSTSYDSTVIPPTSAARAAELGVAATLQQFAATVNARGAALTSTDLQQYMTMDLLHGGEDRAIFSAGAATSLRGLTITNFSISRINSYDETNDILDIQALLTISQGSQSGTERIGLVFKRVGSAYLMYGNQRVAEVEDDSVQFESRTDAFSTGTTTSTSIDVQVNAPVGIVNSITVSGPGGFSNTALMKDTQTHTEILEPTPTTTLNWVTDSFFGNSGPITLPSTPATYTFTLNLNPSGTAVYTATTRGSAGEAVNFSVTPNTHSAAAVKGQTITVSWSLPQTYAVEEIDLRGNMSDGSTTVTIEPPQLIGNTATSGTLTFVPPAGTPNPSSFNPVGFNLSFTGPNGERTLLIWGFDLP